MALVAYDNSDSSELEDEEESATVVTHIKPSVTQQSQVKVGLELPKPIKQDDTVSDDGLSLFNLLPQPTAKKPSVIEEDDEFLHKKEHVKPKAKIIVPSLNDFKDVPTPTAVKPKISNGKKSGLLSILPQPKGSVISTKSLIPHVLTQKPNTVKKKEILPSLSKNIMGSKPLINDFSDDSDNDDGVENDFFSINKPVEELPAVDLPSDINDPKETVTKQPRSIESYFKQDVVENSEMQTEYHDNDTADYGSYEASSSNNDNEPEASNSNDVELDDEAIKKLIGSRGKRKREEIHIVDINQRDVLKEARDMLLKGLLHDTSKRVSSSKKKGNEPTNQQKRKHQITYLAHQAKANEAELQNQWANNRMSKRQTQSKYGF